MHNSKLLALFSSLNEKEFKDFEKFLLFQTENSSYASQLFYIIKNAAPDFSSKSLAKELVFNKIYGKEAFKDVKVRELMSVLRKHLDNFLIYLEHNKGDYYNNLARVGLFYEELNYEKGLPFFQMLPNALIVKK